MSACVGFICTVIQTTPRYRSGIEGRYLQGSSVVKPRKPLKFENKMFHWKFALTVVMYPHKKAVKNEAQ